MDSRKSMFTTEEMRSMYLWDAWCEAMPLTAEERRESARRDEYAKSTNGYMSSRPGTQSTVSDAERNRAYAARYRANHHDRIIAYNRAHADEINERQREYRRYAKMEG